MVARRACVYIDPLKLHVSAPGEGLKVRSSGAKQQFRHHYTDLGNSVKAFTRSKKNLLAYLEVTKAT